MADPKTHEPYTIPGVMDSALPITRWSANTARMSIRRRMPKAESPWTRSAQTDDPAAGRIADDTPHLAKDPNHAFSVEDLKAWERLHGRV